MGYRYIAIADSSDMATEHTSGATHTTLSQMGLQYVTRIGPLILFASGDTPTLVLPQLGVIVGHLFLRDGTPLTESSKLPLLGSPASFRSFVIKECWGEYVLFQPYPEEQYGFSVLRDPSGGAQCIYSQAGATRFLTSDISLATRTGLYQRRVNWDFIAHYLTFPYLKTQRTGLVDIGELLPGHALHYQGKILRTEEVWSPWAFVAPGTRHGNPREAAAELRSVVEMVVRRWAETDRSILMELSGGLDSSIVAACLRQTKARVVCGTLVTPMPGADERMYAAVVAAALGLSLHEKVLRTEDARFDSTPPPSSVVPCIGPLQYVIDESVQRIREAEGVACFYSGGGGDTVFSYLASAAPAADACKERGIAAGFRAMRDLAGIHRSTLWKVGRLTARKLIRKPAVTHQANTFLIRPDAAAKAPDLHPWFDFPEGTFPGDRERVLDLASTQLFRESAQRGVTHWLRLPLLDQPVVETCLRIPTWMWIADGKNRSIARSAFSDVLPTKVLDRRSKGDFIQYLGAIYRRNTVAMQDFILGGELNARQLIDVEALAHYLQHNHTPKDQSFTRIFDLCMVENWVRHQT